MGYALIGVRIHSFIHTPKFTMRTVTSITLAPFSNPMCKTETHSFPEWGTKFGRKYGAGFLKHFNGVYDEAGSVSSLHQRSAPLAYVPLPSSSDSLGMATEAEPYLQEAT
jgi:hypothetical protein